MVRDVANRYRGLPPRTPEMLLQVIRKFYRGAVSHYAWIQEKKAETLLAWQQYRQTGEPHELGEALTVLFQEFHFYVTCWLQIDLALFRLARMEETKAYQEVREQFEAEIERHLAVRAKLEDIPNAVETQYLHFGAELRCVPEDRYWFEGTFFTVEEDSLHTLHELARRVSAITETLQQKEPPCQ
ncbi:hypothetical protein [Brevibacillus migulae]|uniref:hypothetical protein n=1 Tax=Brevibacillus migulae TaxID=1644114 RepID=UPI00106E1AEB|nr:hypothetical protein [Brevibacillus migulae]